MGYKIKKDKYSNTIEIDYLNSVIFQGDTESFIELSTKIMNFITKENWRISTDKELGRQGGIYYYHLTKNFILSWIFDLKKWLKNLLRKKS